jgi:hypothetical protein
MPDPNQVLADKQGGADYCKTVKVRVGSSEVKNV